MGGGILATAMTMAITYASGSVVVLSGWLGDAWAHVTPGQAAIVIGLLTYATHNVPRLARWLAGLRRKVPGNVEVNDDSDSP